MQQYLRGRAKFFNQKENYGFLAPNKKDQPDVLLLEKFYSFPRADNGVLFLPLEENDIRFRFPSEGDMIIYMEMETQKEPIAFPWTFAEYWDGINLELAKSEVGINITNHFIRIIGNSKRGNRSAVLWKGYQSEFNETFQKGMPKDFKGRLLIQKLTEKGWVDKKIKK